MFYAMKLYILVFVYCFQSTEKCLHMSEKFSSRAKNPNKQTNKQKNPEIKVYRV